MVGSELAFCAATTLIGGGVFKGPQFTRAVILCAVWWYLMFPVSYRDLELMLHDCGVAVDHTTSFNRIQTQSPSEIILFPGGAFVLSGGWMPSVEMRGRSG
jgi:hypothetical protein